MGTQIDSMERKNYDEKKKKKNSYVIINILPKKWIYQMNNWLVKEKNTAELLVIINLNRIAHY